MVCVTSIDLWLVSEVWPQFTALVKRYAWMWALSYLLPKANKVMCESWVSGRSSQPFCTPHCTYYTDMQLHIFFVSPSRLNWYAVVVERIVFGQSSTQCNALPIMGFIRYTILFLCASWSPWWAGRCFDWRVTYCCAQSSKTSPFYNQLALPNDFHEMQ